MLSAGTRLGPYEIVASIGAGGMGEVYRARDRRLDRTVAIKVLPPHIAADPAFRERFEREARTISQLNHPHICTLYDVGFDARASTSSGRTDAGARGPAVGREPVEEPTEERVDFLVLEYLEGETLADRLRKGALPVDQALRIAIEVGDGLDKAHRQGIVHRDLKPGNVMLTKSGAKLLDFGLAKRGPAEAGHDQDAAAPPTMTTPLTAQGTLLGTFQYMAPEQLEGAEADARSDIWAFACVLYEMVSGKRPFEGKTPASLMSAIMKDEAAPLTTRDAAMPAALDYVIRRGLAKDPEERWMTMHDVLLQLRWIADRKATAEVDRPARLRWSTRAKLAIASTAVAIAAVVALGVAYFVSPQGRRGTVVRFNVLAPPNTTFQSAGFAVIIPAPVVSHDGKTLAFVAFGADGRQLLWVRPLDSFEARPLAGTDAASFPFWSPDDRFLGFFADRKLKRIDTSGGPPQALCDADGGQGGTWSRDGIIVFAPTTGSALYRVPATGGTPAPVTDLDAKTQELSHRWPSFLPDGRHFLYLARRRESGAVFVGSIDSKERRLVVRVDSNAIYTAPDRLLFRRDDVLVTQPFDTVRVAATGDPVSVVQQIQYDSLTGLAAFSISDTGVLAYRTGNAAGTSQLVWFDRSGKRLEALGEPREFTVPQLSPDGRKVAVAMDSATGSGGEIWIRDLVRGSFSRLTFGTGIARCCPVWSPDGSKVAYRVGAGSAGDIYQKNANGAGDEQPLLKNETVNTPTDWTADGRFLLYQIGDSRTKVDILALPLAGVRKPIPLLHGEFNEHQGRVSPDGRWIAYSSDESGTPQVYVQSFPSLSGKWQVSTTGGADPRWRRDGRELFFIGADRKLTAVAITPGATFEAGLPQPLFEIRVSGLVDVRAHYAVTADGSRFLVNTPIDSPTSSAINVIVNWPAALKK